jgi:hypothetical protein
MDKKGSKRASSYAPAIPAQPMLPSQLEMPSPTRLQEVLSGFVLLSDSSDLFDSDRYSDIEVHLDTGVAAVIVRAHRMVLRRCKTLHPMLAGSPGRLPLPSVPAEAGKVALMLVYGVVSVLDSTQSDVLLDATRILRNWGFTLDYFFSTYMASAIVRGWTSLSTTHKKMYLNLGPYTRWTLSPWQRSLGSSSVEEATSTLDLTVAGSARAVLEAPTGSHRRTLPREDSQVLTSSFSRFVGVSRDAATYWASLERDPPALLRAWERSNPTLPPPDTPSPRSAAEDSRRADALNLVASVLGMAAGYQVLPARSPRPSEPSHGDGRA